jgi:hypothetical protein
MQTRIQSLAESSLNIFIGFWINVGLNILIFPFFDINISVESNIHMGLVYTGISLARQYLIRRYFTSKES